MEIKAGPLLSKITYPSDLRKLKKEQLPQLCMELRQYIIDNVSVYGGHFGASMGAVELTVAIHYVFDTPNDQLVWDVGHQAYGHKILTGRKDKFYTNRKYKGLSGFPKRTSKKLIRQRASAMRDTPLNILRLSCQAKTSFFEIRP